MRFMIEESAAVYESGIRILLEERGHDVRLVTEKEERRGSAEKAAPGSVLEWRIEREAGERGVISVQILCPRLVIACGERAHFFRGLMKAVMRLEKSGEGAYHARERVWFKTSGAMLDCSRNGVLRLDAVKRYIRRQASLGLNRLMLYTEETYQIQGQPYFGAFRGRYTPEELRECDEYGAVFGVELIPCIQALAHLHTALRWKEYEKLRDTEDILLAGDEAVYQLIEDMVKTMSSSFRSRCIHLGMDEAHGLGLGNYLRRYGYQDRFKIMDSHLRRVCEICREYGMKPMIWSDMYFRLLSPAGDYYDLPADTDFSGSPKPPEDVTLVYWDYYHDEKEYYDSYFRLHRKLSPKTVFAGGAWIWNGVAPNYSKMAATTEAAFTSCRENGIEDVLYTFWQDNGAETPMEAGNLPLTVFASYGFSTEAEETGGKSGQEMAVADKGGTEAAGEWMEFLWGDPIEAWLLLDGFDHTPGTGSANREAANPSKYLLYQDVLAGLFDAQVRGLELGRHYAGLADSLDAYVSSRPDSSLIFHYYRVLARLLAQKADLGIRIYDSYHAGDLDDLRTAAEKILPEIIRLSKELLEYRRQLWFEECRPFGFEVLDIRMAGVTARLESCRKRLTGYLDGSVGSLAELEEERVPYQRKESIGEGRLCSCNLWQDIVSAGNMAGV